MNEKQVNFFKDNGYLVLDDVIPFKVLDEVVNELNAEIDKRAKELFENGALKQTYSAEGFESRLAKISAETPKLAVSIWNGILHGPAIFELITNCQILDEMEHLVGKEIIASSVYRLRPKIPNFGYGEVPWHQDSAYFEPYCDDHLIVTVWIPLVDATLENGCMHVIPQSHKNKVVEHQASVSGKYLEVKNELLPKDNWVACPVKKGGILLLTNKVMHASFKNNTNGVRWSMDLRYQSAALPTNSDIRPMPNEIRKATHPDAPAACYPPEADFLVRSKARKEQVTHSFADFNRLRQNYVGVPVTNRYNVQWKELDTDEL